MVGLATVGLAGVGSKTATAAQLSASDSLAAKLGRGFTSEVIRVNGVKIHYVRGGTGPAIVLLHGFPQDWWEWHDVMPRLAARFTVIAADLRGAGESDAPSAGYDKATLAQDIYGLVQQLKLQRVYVAGHDIGGMVAYAYARLYPDDLRGIMILDVPLPGLDPWDAVYASPFLWHFQFHQIPGLAEALVADRQRTYFQLTFFDRFVLHKGAIRDAEIDHFAKAYGDTARLHAGFEYYRAFLADGQFNQAQRGSLDLPITLAGGDHSVGRINPAIAESLNKYGCTNVTVEPIADSEHFVVDEQPAVVAALIERYASR